VVIQVGIVKQDPINCCARVRNVNVDELAKVYEIELESFDNPYSMHYFRILMSLSGKYFLVSEDESGEITGYIVAIPLKGRVCHIASIAVSKSCRGRRTGTCLLSSLLQLCQDDGYDAFILEVEATNNVALRLYLSAGFKIVGIKPNYYGRGRHALIMLLIDTSSWRSL
jgi:ribosomal-protein-alanine N-acetyltransferase